MDGWRGWLALECVTLCVRAQGCQGLDIAGSRKGRVKMRGRDILPSDRFSTCSSSLQ